jgi:hypothetical protein
VVRSSVMLLNYELRHTHKFLFEAGFCGSLACRGCFRLIIRWLQLNCGVWAGETQGLSFVGVAAAGAVCGHALSLLDFVEAEKGGVDGFVSKIIRSLCPLRRHSAALQRKEGGPPA